MACSVYSLNETQVVSAERAVSTERVHFTSQDCVHILNCDYQSFLGSQVPPGTSSVFFSENGAEEQDDVFLKAGLSTDFLFFIWDSSNTLSLS